MGFVDQVQQEDECLEVVEVEDEVGNAGCPSCNEDSVSVVEDLEDQVVLEQQDVC